MHKYFCLTGFYVVSRQFIHLATFDKSADVVFFLISEFNFFYTTSCNKLKMRFGVQFLLLSLALVALSVAKDEKEKNKDIGTVIGIDLGTTYSW